MSNPIHYKGAKWYKCDLHLHTPASKCFQDKSVTAEQWVQKAIEQNLDCVAVTDHNTGDWIDNIKLAAQGSKLTVYPGVEITCDTSKVHLLVLFDTAKTSTDINDFLIRCGIDRHMFANQLAGTTLTIFEVAEKAFENGAIVIPAHIDEYNGLGAISNENLKKFCDLSYINAVQVVHNQFTNIALQTNDNEELKNYLNEYYSTPSPAIDYAKISEWHRPVKVAISKDIAITTFSDNPHEPKNSKHGLDGIGKRYTWIKMDEAPSLEGLRQAFLLSKFRVKNDFISPNVPYKTPDLWIKSISISGTIITDEQNKLQIDFNPQLNTIIGGRGSGKSSILRFLRGVFNRIDDLSPLIEIIADHNEFYKHHDTRTQKGVLTDNSIIEIEFVRNNVLHKIIASNIKNSTNQNVSIEKFDALSQSWIAESSEGYIDFFKYDHYSQKQIYEIAQEPNCLRDRIDKSVPEIETLKNEREIIKKSFLEKSASIRRIQQQVSSKGKLQTEIADYNDRIKLFQQSGIADLLNAKEKYTSQENLISAFISKLEQYESEVESLFASIDIPEVDYSTFSENHSDELRTLSKAIFDGYAEIKQGLKEAKQKAENLRLNFESSIPVTNWQKDLNQNQTEFNNKRQELEQQGINDISNFEKVLQFKALKEKEIERIIAIEQALNSEIIERNKLQNDYLLKCKEITSKRKNFIATLWQDDKVKVSINPFRNKSDFAKKIRTVLQRNIGFERDIDYLCDLCFNGNVEQQIKKIREVFLEIKNGGEISEVTGYFVNLVSGMTDAQIDEIELLLPEDDIDIKYKPYGSSSFKPLSTASAGQKTTAILTFILSHGDIPLVLDQPEDDLDNRLVYELIVDRLKQAKIHRQIIVVTHNANIPVNGDAEYILSMDSESKKLKVICSGTVDQPAIKKEICDVMEGSEQAFDMRLRRYKQIR